MYTDKLLQGEQLSWGENFTIFTNFGEICSPKHVFVKIGESLSHPKLMQTVNLMKIETDLLEFA